MGSILNVSLFSLFIISLAKILTILLTNHIFFGKRISQLIYAVEYVM